MKQDLWRFMAVLAIGLIVGLITGQVLLCLLAGTLLYVYWQFRVIMQLWRWIMRRSEESPEDMPGVINELAKQFDFIRSHHKQREEKLSGYLKRFQESTDALPDAVVVLGENSTIEWANRNARRYLGVCWPQDMGQRISNLIRNPSLLDYMRDVDRHDGDRGLELMAPTDPELRLELRIVPYGDTQQLLVARDITRIYHTNRMRRDFIANASHELRTPLTVISGYLEAFEDETGGEMKKWAEPIAQMRSQTDRMRRLIEDLLKLAVLESEVKSAVPETVDVPELLSEIYQEAKRVSGAIDHLFTLEIDGDLLLKGNRSELYSAFSNLVFNAVQYTPQGGVITIRWYRDDSGSACFDVIDTGDGISREHLPRLTERFYRVDKGRSRERGGTGLGLAIVKHVVAKHKGTLNITSEPGKGSRFSCRFPPSTALDRDQQNGISSAG